MKLSLLSLALMGCCATATSEPARQIADSGVAEAAPARPHDAGHPYDANPGNPYAGAYNGATGQIEPSPVLHE